jgi:hypothetical protein
MRIGSISLSVLFMLLLLVSCSSSKYQNGFVYKPSHQGPGFSGNMAGETDSPVTTEATAELMTAHMSSVDGPAHVATATAPASTATEALTSPDLASTELGLLTMLAKEQASTLKDSEPVNASRLVHDLAAGYAAEKQVTLSQKQLRKLDRYAVKLQKKQQKMAEVNWAPSNNLEIFILAAAGVGVVVGLFSGIGWFVFLLAALAYLYLKLLA